MLRTPPKITLKNEAETANLARGMAAIVQPGDTVLLSGDIGAGKTFFARSLIQSILLQPEDVPSPTYTLVQTYQTNRGPVLHADLYRLTSADEAIELGLDEAFSTAICLIEWPDRLSDLAPETALTLHFSTTPDPDQRLVECTATSDGWLRRLESLLHD